MTKSAEILRHASATLKQERPGMSIRAVAARLKVSPSYWSKVLRGQRPLSQNLLPRVVKTLGMDVQQMARLQRSILDEIENGQLAPATGLRTQKKNKSPVDGYKSLGQPHFWLLDKWFHIPILNAYTLGRDLDIAQMAKRLNIDVVDANASTERMLRDGFLRLDANGVIERSDLQVRFPTARSHPQVRQYHGEMIKRALDEISADSAEVGFDSRLISSVNFAGSKEKLQTAKLILEEAMFRAANLMSEGTDCEEVYQLNVQLFPLTK